MKKHKFQPGDVVVSNFRGYQHWSIVSDRKCLNNEYMLISATQRSGTVKEEAFKEVTQGCFTYKVAGFDTTGDRLAHIYQARSFIGKWQYSLLGANCEHFVNFIFFGEAKSSQVGSAIAGALVFGGVLALALRNPKLSQVLLLSAISGCLSVYSSRAQECLLPPPDLRETGIA